MTVELLTLVALWCGNPMNHNSMIVGTVRRTHAQVDQCREKLISCIESKIALETCVKETKLNQ